MFRALTLFLHSGIYSLANYLFLTSLVCVLQEGMQLISEKPETEAVVKEKLTGLHKMWEVLESTTQTKAQRLFDANKAELFTQSCAELDKWLHGLESKIQSDDYGKDLTSFNILLKKQQASGQDRVLTGPRPLHGFPLPPYGSGVFAFPLPWEGILPPDKCLPCQQ